MAILRRTKRSGRFSEPTLPGNPVVSESGVELRYYLGTLGGQIEHGPPHLHVYGEGQDTRVGQNGRPLKNSPTLSARQREVVEQNYRTIRRAIRKIARWHFFETL